MIKRFVCSLLLFICASMSFAADIIPDPALRAAIREHIQLPVDVPIEVRHLQQLVDFRPENRGISNLTGFEHASNLRFLDISDNPITDLSPLANLIALEELHFWQDPPRSTNLDLRPLAKLTNLRRIVVSGNGITDISPLANLQGLTRLSLDRNNIDDLSPLMGLVNLKEMDISRNPITDLSPLANLKELEDLGFGQGPPRPINLDLSPLAHLTNLRVLALSGNGITDISSLADLQRLTHLYLDRNHISDFRPLVGLRNLRVLWVVENRASDLSMLSHLNLTTFKYDASCRIDPILPAVADRIQHRDYPSIFDPFSVNLIESIEVGKSDLWSTPGLYDERLTKHDLVWQGNYRHLTWHLSASEPTDGLSTRLVGDMAAATAMHEDRLKLNPNLISLISLNFEWQPPDALPVDSDFWLRDRQGNFIVHPYHGAEYVVNLLNLEFQEKCIQKVVSIAACGLYDGILVDSVRNNGTGFYGRRFYPEITDQQIIDAYTHIFSRIRERVRDDFLVIVNVNRTKPTAYAEYLNGIFMELNTDHPDGYTYEGLQEIEDTLVWADVNSLAPQITCLEGQGLWSSAPDTTENKRWMRVFTTMSLTLSDGYMRYTFVDSEGLYHGHIWYDFWDADLGKPVGEKEQLYKNRQGESIDGLFIREYTNGWAVYNRSGKARMIQLPENVNGWESGIIGTEHTVPDLDGEIYLKRITDRHDVNGDGRINVLDLVIVANAIGKTEPDVNGDGTVNVLDLVQVANQIGE